MKGTVGDAALSVPQLNTKINPVLISNAKV